MSKVAWIAVIILVPLIGPLLWLFFGRVRKDGPAAQQKRPSAPDDDPEFLRGVEFRRRQAQRREEEERKRREQEQKKNRDKPKDDEETSDGTDSDDESPGQPNT